MDIRQENILDIVKDNYKTGLVFNKYGLDLCKNRNKTIEQASRENDINPENIFRDIEKLNENADAVALEKMSADEKIEFITSNFHTYIREIIPVITQHLEKIARVHGEKFPELNEVLPQFIKLKDLLASHINKEEKLFFPTVKAKMKDTESTTDLNCRDKKPLKFVRPEHEAIIELLDEIRDLTDDFDLPYDKCLTFRTVYLELAELDEKLNKLIEVEEKILEQTTGKHGQGC